MPHGKEVEKDEEIKELAESFKKDALLLFDKRELRLIKNCIEYSQHDPAGFPGHNLILIINKLALEVGFDVAMIKYCLDDYKSKDV